MTLFGTGSLNTTMRPSSAVMIRKIKSLILPLVDINIIINLHKHHPFFASSTNSSVSSQILFSSHVIFVKKIYCYLIDINDIYSWLPITRRMGGGGGEGKWARVFSWRRDRPLLVSVNRDVLKNCSVNRDWSALRETWTARILDCLHVH